MADAPTNDRNPMAGLSQLGGQLRGLWRKQSKRRRAVAVLAIVGVIGFVAFTAIKPTGDSWQDVVPGGAGDDAAEIGSLLAARGIKYRIDGGRVQVPTDRVTDARAVAAAAGLPRSGAGFELFDKTSLGQSAFSEQINYRRALQGELARSITALAQVAGARVHLAMGRRSVFKGSDEPPSASVALHLHPGQKLSRDQVDGVRQMVAAAVDGLKPDAVVVLDNRGTPLDAGSQQGPDERRDEIEHTIAGRVKAILERVVGTGKAAVVATADIDTSSVNETEELYDKDRTALRSEARTVDGPDAGSAGGGVAGVRGNLPGATGASSAPAETPGRLQETRNYEVSRVVRQTSRPDPRLRRMHLAVLIDYKPGADGKPPVPRTAAELAELTALAREAAGIDDTRGDRIEVRSIPFVVEADAAAAGGDAAAEASELPQYIYYIAAGAGALVLIVVAFVVLRGKKGKKHKKGTLGVVVSLPAPVSELERALDAPEDPRGRPALPSGKTVHDRVLDAVKQDTTRASSILSAWLAEAPQGAPAQGAPRS